MIDKRGFLKYHRKNPEYRSKDERLKDFKSVELSLTDKEIYEQAARCMNCGTPFCHSCGCPLGNIIPEFNNYVIQHRWKEALDILIETSSFPEFTGRLCPALCEASCVLGINDDPVTIRQIELSIIEKGFESGDISPKIPAKRHIERVAVIGSGPAGLAAADVLNKFGYNVVVYEHHKKPGGILMYGIPEFKLEKWIVDRRIKLMEDEGIVFETGVEVGKDISYHYLQNRFDAVILTGGAMAPRDLNVPGRELNGIHFAMEYLVQQNRRLNGELLDGEDEISVQGKTVVIIGGGDTGSDCLGTALRQGAKDVYQFEIMPKPLEYRSDKKPWPMWPDTLKESSSHKEGGKRRWCVSTKKFTGKNGLLNQIHCIEVDWVKSDGNERPVPVEQSGTEFTIDVELVILAMGFVGPGKNEMVENLRITLDNRGFVCHNKENMTNIDGVFTAGDIAEGPSLVVRAIMEGKKAAAGVMKYLEDKSSL